jgi:hypothetical protein
VVASVAVVAADFDSPGVAAYLYTGKAKSCVSCGNRAAASHLLDGFKALVRSISYKWSFSALFGTKRRNAALRLGDHALAASGKPTRARTGSRTAS